MRRELHVLCGKKYICLYCISYGDNRYFSFWVVEWLIYDSMKNTALHSGNLLITILSEGG